MLMKLTIKDTDSFVAQMVDYVSGEKKSVALV